MDLDEAYQAYVNDLYRYLFSLSKEHYTAEDLVQEAFYRAYLHLENEEILNIKAWLFKVAYRVFIDYSRKQKRVVVSEKVGEELQITSPEKKILEKESFRLLLDDIHTLKEQERDIVLLCDLHKMSYQEAADILEMNLNTLKSHLLRGRRKIIAIVQERRKRDDRES
ncbi:sigma-70 family RNA polymerase sigma factor [Robertmurraya yapensis]|uniref:Sigma-70 family RNA polymerase sigma factor n=1 Tax=Bacillus yapensis TaxID=2492960 RepID=A0A3S0RDR4_9BACI|nr:sigma-70 family RNA polymerase sigma factor [Bacillus yapensis]RTR25842.1 sigma-70 family RNA polymerase sigma factor [Bacillus yapensis]TKS93508.1 sigma-70 family RNA polymerase sigma factor [Bacillus yapensis]